MTAASQSTETARKIRRAKYATESWRKRITTDSVTQSPRILQEPGECLVRGAIATNSAGLLRADISAATCSLDRTVLSGGAKQLIIGTRQCRSHVMEGFLLDLQHVFGSDFNMPSRCSVIETPDYPTKDQAIHSDSTVRCHLKMLLVLSPTAESPRFLPQLPTGSMSYHRIGSNLQIIDPVEREAFERDFEQLKTPLQAKRGMVSMSPSSQGGPRSQGMLLAGDLILFVSLMLHYGVSAQNNKKLVFMQLTRKG
jgi:hypothetical protein